MKDEISFEKVNKKYQSNKESSEMSNRLSKNEKNGILNGSSLIRIREYPNENAKVIQLANEGCDVVKISDASNDFIKIKINNKVGYVLSKFWKEV